VSGWAGAVAGSRACQLARKDVRKPERWVVLQRNTKSLGTVLGRLADCIAAARNLLETHAYRQHRGSEPSVPGAGAGAEARPQSASGGRHPQRRQAQTRLLLCGRQ